jgi:hypothetical protein
VAARLDQMIGNLFYHKVSPAEIKAMRWRELCYWDGWVKVLNKEIADARQNPET